jgi:hypothetical protein
MEPSREGLLAAFAELAGDVQGVLTGATPYATASALPASTGSNKIYLVTSDPTVANNGYWQDQSGGNTILTALNAAFKGTPGTMAGATKTDMLAGTSSVLAVTPSSLSAASLFQNVWPDPFGEQLPLRPMLGNRVNAAYGGTAIAVDAASPWGKGSVTATGSNVAQRIVTIGDLNAKAGDILSLRVSANFSSTGGSVSAFFRDASGASLSPGPISVTGLASGLLDVPLPSTVIPANTATIELRATLSGGTKIIFAVAAAIGAYQPAFIAAAKPGSLTNVVQTQKNLWEDPFLRRYVAGARFRSGGWGFSELAGVSIPAIVTTNSTSPFPTKNVIRLPTGAAAVNINFDLRTIGLKAGDKVTVAAMVYSAQAVPLDIIMRDGSNAVIGTTMRQTTTFIAAGWQQITMTYTITQTMVDTGVYGQLRWFATGSVGATPVDITGLSLFVNDTQPLIYDDCYLDDMAAIERHRAPGFGYNRMRETHKRIMALKMGAAAVLTTQLSIALIGDSYTHLPQRASGPYVAYMQGAYGDAGYGFVGFGNPDAGQGNINGTNWKGLTVTTVGTWTTSYATGYGPDACQVTASGAANIYKVNNIVAGNGLTINILAQPVASTSYDWSIDGGTTWTTVDASTGTNINNTTLTGLPTTGAFAVWIRPNAGSPVLYGLDLRNTAKGVRINKLGATGSSAAQWAARVVDPKWQASIAALNPDQVRIMLGPNDQTSSTLPNVFAGYIQTIVTAVQTACPRADILIMVPEENQRTSNLVEMAAYAAAVRAVAITSGTAFRHLQQDYGAQAADYSSTSTRPWHASDNIHPDPANDGGFPIVNAERDIAERTA